MPDDLIPKDPNAGDETEPTPEVPASVTFIEIMRQAAAKSAAQQPVTPADQLFARAAESLRPNAGRSGAAAAQTAPVQLAEVEAQAQRHADALEAQRIRRVKRRRARRRRQTVGVLGGIVRSFLVISIAAGLMATIFMWLTPSQFIADHVKAELSQAESTPLVVLPPTPIPTPNWLRRIGIVSGHRGPQVPPDPGAVCPDGLTEAEINFAVAQRVVLALRERGYSVDLLDEFDPRLEDYQAAALVSIHANTCQNFGEVVSGYLIARASARTLAGADDLLVECVAQYYQQAVGLERRTGLTRDMTDYHSFREIHPLTPAAIIELGFMLADRDVLTLKQDEMAKGITDGILCFLEPSQAVPGATPTTPDETLIPG